MAAGDELHQGLVPGRTPDFADLLADGVGIGVAALLWWWGSVRWGHRRLS
ncbi:MAG: VanZ family protein [Planctomycetota bacterium]